ncbi:hypothetical protein ACOME3_007236 [Neoechinorhynchus agilis]
MVQNFHIGPEESDDDSANFVQFGGHTERKRRRKLKIKFNENDRREYLLGFRKRKQERRKIVCEKLEQEVKNGLKALRKQRKAKQMRELKKLSEDGIFENVVKTKEGEMHKVEMPGATVLIHSCDWSKEIERDEVPAVFKSHGEIITMKEIEKKRDRAANIRLAIAGRKRRQHRKK